MNKIKISNKRLWEIKRSNENINQWLSDNIGYENYTESIAVNDVPPTVCWTFKNERDAVLFSLRWT